MIDYAKAIVENESAIAALKAERAKLEKEGKDFALAERAAIKQEFEWRVVWASPRVMSVECRLTDSTCAALAEWKAKWPWVSYGSSMNEPGKWHGMSFYLVGNTIISTGGGSVILALKDSWRDKEPQDLTQAQADSFRAGIVPEELKKGW